MHLKLTRGVLIGNHWREPGHVFEAEGKYAESFVRTNAAVPCTPPVESATANPRSAERATAPRQR